MPGDHVGYLRNLASGVVSAIEGIVAHIDGDTAIVAVGAASIENASHTFIVKCSESAELSVGFTSVPIAALYATSHPKWMTATNKSLIGAPVTKELQRGLIRLYWTDVSTILGHICPNKSRPHFGSSLL